jgi:hypothetical protein
MRKANMRQRCIYLGDDDLYSGDFVNGKFHGKGIRVWAKYGEKMKGTSSLAYKPEKER